MVLMKTWEVFAQSSEPEAYDSLVYKTPAHCFLTGQCLSFLFTNKPTISVTIVR